MNGSLFRSGCRKQEENINTFKVNLFSFYYSVLFFLHSIICEKVLLAKKKVLFCCFAELHLLLSIYVVYRKSGNLSKVKVFFMFVINIELRRKYIKLVENSKEKENKVSFSSQLITLTNAFKKIKNLSATRVIFAFLNMNKTAVKSSFI